MSWSFNTGGPCDPEIHYMLDPVGRLPEVRALIDTRAYFVLHAPRQIGKTTSFMALARKLTEEGTYASVVLSMEVGSPLQGNLDRMETAILSSWRARAEDTLPLDL